ncbi:MAG: hypothetical protein K5739_05030 [Lachnospiraceae bacterium]|nr:hypothetical protein [Lachnospiraceae bacterium]
MKQAKMKKVLGAALAGVMSLVTAFSLNVTTVLADPETENRGTVIVDLSKDMEETNPEKAPIAGIVYTDEQGDVIMNTLRAMEKVGQIKNLPIEGGEEFMNSDQVKCYDLPGPNLDGAPDILVLVIDFGSMKGTAIQVLGTRGEQLCDDYELEPSAAAIAVAEGPYSDFLDFMFPPKHEHRWSTKWTEGKNGHYHACLNSTCPLNPNTDETKMDGYTPHTYGNWKVITYATNDKEGSRERVCTACAHKDTQVIPKGQGDGSSLDQKPSDGKDGQDGKDGKDGKDNKDGKDGTQIAKTTLTVKPAKKTAAKNSKKAQKIKLKITTNSKGKITYSTAPTAKKLRKYIKVKKGVVTIKKKAPKGTYKIKVTVAADAGMKAASTTVKIKVK